MAASPIVHLNTHQVSICDIFQVGRTLPLVGEGVVIIAQAAQAVHFER